MQRNRSETYCGNLGQEVIVLFIKRQVLECNIDIWVSTILTVKLFSVTTSREPVLVDLVLDLVGRVGHVNSGVGVGCRHFSLCALERRKELAVQQSWLGVLELVSNITGQSEVRVLVDGARNETGYIVLLPKDLRE